MSLKNINLLIIEDCPFTVQGYKSVLKHCVNKPFNISVACNCDEAVQPIKTKKHELVLLDLQLPISKNEKYLSGEDIGLLIRKTQKDTKIIILTNISDRLRVNNIIESINPEGFINELPRPKGTRYQNNFNCEECIFS